MPTDPKATEHLEAAEELVEAADAQYRQGALTRAAATAQVATAHASIAAAICVAETALILDARNEY